MQMIRWYKWNRLVQSDRDLSCHSGLTLFTRMETLNGNTGGLSKDPAVSTSPTCLNLISLELPGCWSLSHLWPLYRGDVVFLEINSTALVWEINKKRPAGTAASRLTVPGELKRHNAPAGIKLFLLAVITSGTYDMPSSGWLTFWQEGSLFDLHRSKPPNQSTAPGVQRSIRLLSKATLHSLFNPIMTTSLSFCSPLHHADQNLSN